MWKRQRKMASHIFSVANFNSHIQTTVHHDLGKLDNAQAYRSEPKRTDADALS